MECCLGTHSRPVHLHQLATTLRNINMKFLVSLALLSVASAAPAAPVLPYLGYGYPGYVSGYALGDYAGAHAGVYAGQHAWVLPYRALVYSYAPYAVPVYAPEVIPAAAPYVHDAAGDVAEAYVHDVSGDVAEAAHAAEEAVVIAAEAYSHDDTGDVASAYVHDAAGDVAEAAPASEEAEEPYALDPAGTALLSLDTSVDTSLISQCSGTGLPSETSNCRAVQINQEVLDGLSASATTRLLSFSQIVLTLSRPPTQNSGSRSFAFTVGGGGEASITVGNSGAMYGSIHPDEGSVNYTIESCGNGCNVIYERDQDFFNQFYD